MKKVNKSINLNYINESRNILLGIATIMIVLFHSPSLNFNNILGYNLSSNILNFIRKICNIGVDIFLFLSGIGLYFSYSKNNIKQFYKNRFKKIIPPVIIFMCIYYSIIGVSSIKELFEHFLLLSFFINGNRSFWYISFLLLLYILFPIIYKIIKNKNFDGLIILLFITIMFNFLVYLLSESIYTKIEIALTRIPIFIIGVYFGQEISQNKEIPYNTIKISFIIQLLFTLILVFVINLNNSYFFTRYLYCPLAITICLNISTLCHNCKFVKNVIAKPLIILGKYSLEFYLIYEKLGVALKNIFIFPTYLYYYSFIFFTTLILSYLLINFTNKILYKKLNFQKTVRQN